VSDLRIPYAPPSLFAYSSSIRSSYSLSAARSSSVFSECVADATDCVEGFSTSRAVCADEELLVFDEVDFSVVAGIGTGIVKAGIRGRGLGCILGVESLLDWELKGWRDCSTFSKSGRCYIRGEICTSLWRCKCGWKLLSCDRLHSYVRKTCASGHTSVTVPGPCEPVSRRACAVS